MFTIKKNNYFVPLCEVIKEESSSVLCQSTDAGVTTEQFTEENDFTF